MIETLLTLMRAPAQPEQFAKRAHAPRQAPGPARSRTMPLGTVHAMIKNLTIFDNIN